ncbi:MAG: MFS transporter, partial [Pseudohongiellaceae bacterium]
MSSGFGQTFFISIFGGEIRAAFDLSHTAYGSLYATATVISALLLVRLGTLVDIWPLHRVAMLTVLLLAGGCLLLGLAAEAVMLWLGFLLIRLGGQGMMGHLGMTVAGRYFTADRGKAVAFIAMGFPLSEAILPVSAVILMQAGSWSLPWLLSALLLLLVVLPLLWILARQVPTPDRYISTLQEEDYSRKQYTRRDALRDPGLYLLLPALLAPPFIVTGILFHQSAIAELRNWPLTQVAGAFSVFAAGHLLSLFAAGPLVDRMGAQRFLPLSGLPMAGGLVLFAANEAIWVIFAYLGLIGITLGLTSISAGAMWAERYGIRHLGAIRSISQGAMILS